MEKVYSVKSLPDLFATMNRAFSAPVPEGKSCLEIINDAIKAQADAQARVVAEARELTHEND